MATTIRMGRAGETEFKVSRQLMSSGGGLAVAYWAEGHGVSQWPAALSDGVAEERIVQGWLPEEAEFRPREWATLAPAGP